MFMDSSQKNTKKEFALRGQSSVEVMVYIGFFLLLFVSFSMFMLMQLNNDIHNREYYLAGQVAGQVADYARLAVDGGDGFSASFKIPNNIDGKPYNITFRNSGWIYVEVIDPEAITPAVYPYPLGFRNVSLLCLEDPVIDCMSGEYTYQYPGTDTIESYVNPSGGRLNFRFEKNETSGKQVLWVYGG
jgi:hypothetical protein